MIGKSAELTKCITDADVVLFANVSLDINPVHLDDEFAKSSIFGNRIAHGMLVGSLISAVIGNKLPGNGSIYLKQEFNFKKPVFINDLITAHVEVVEEIKPSIYKLNTCCKNQSGEIVLDGFAIVKFENKPNE